MTQKVIKTFRNEIFPKPPEKIYPRNKTDVYHNDGIWSSGILDLKDYGSENKLRYRYVLVIKEIFSKIGFTFPLKNKKAQTIKDSFRKTLMN